MSVVIDIAAMGGDLESFSKAAKKFISNPLRLTELKTQLSISAATASKREDRSLRWTTDLGQGPLLSISSRHYRNKEGATPRELKAELAFNFVGILDEADHNRFIVKSGGTCIRLFWTDSEEGTSYHYDIHPNAAGHPMLHIQFDGKIKDVPRLHSFFAHPLDILEFILMEIFQEEWRKVRTGTTFRGQIRKYPEHQQKRFLSLLASYKDWVTAPAPTLISLLNSPHAPLELYPV